MAGRRRYPPDLLARTAAVSTSVVDMLRRLDAPLCSATRRYLRTRLEHHDIDTSHFVDEPPPHRPRQSYSKERLADAAARSRSVREVMTHLGCPPHDSAYSHIRNRLSRCGIDTSHFTDTAKGSHLLPREELTAAVAASASLAAVLRLLNMPVNTTSRRILRRSVAAYGLPTAHFTGQAHGRGKPSPHRRTAQEILRRLAPGSARTSTALLRRALDESRVPRRCAACGTGETWQGRRLVLEIDHINGDRLDNRRANLRHLCPSCHSQTRTFARGGRKRPVRTVARRGTVQ
ncbi:HNH endonuclease [Streptomyces sp. NPDC048248]|uniref:HNH endonuclease n=1 Tax=Streptomyces sp. NPDC048248 TaxID=3365523 RepID=UPI00371FFACF